jgi:hypothetical protein
MIDVPIELAVKDTPEPAPRPDGLPQGPIGLASQLPRNPSSARGNVSGGTVVTSPAGAGALDRAPCAGAGPQAWSLQARPDFDSGSTDTSRPVAANIALSSAGPIGATPGSPTPVGSSPEGTMYTSTFGISFMRRTR